MIILLCIYRNKKVFIKYVLAHMYILRFNIIRTGTRPLAYIYAPIYIILSVCPTTSVKSSQTGPSDYRVTSRYIMYIQYTYIYAYYT